MIEQKFCSVCRKALPPQSTGRPRQTCGARCRQRAHRQTKRQKHWREREDRQFLANGRKQLRAHEKRFGKLNPRVAFRISHLMPFFTCPVCHQPYIKTGWGGFAPKACSAECVAIRDTMIKEAKRAIQRAMKQGKVGNAARIERLMKRKLPFRVCDHCKEPFLPTGIRGPTPRFCSATCRKKDWTIRQRPCPACGKQFDRRNRQGLLRKKYCSKQCYRRVNSWRKADRAGKKIMDGKWHYGYGRGAPRTLRLLRRYENDEPAMEERDEAEERNRF